MQIWGRKISWSTQANKTSMGHDWFPRRTIIIINADRCSTSFRFQRDSAQTCRDFEFDERENSNERVK